MLYSLIYILNQNYQNPNFGHKIPLISHRCPVHLGYTFQSSST